MTLSFLPTHFFSFTVTVFRWYISWLGHMKTTQHCTKNTSDMGFFFSCTKREYIPMWFFSCDLRTHTLTCIINFNDISGFYMNKKQWIIVKLEVKDFTRMTYTMKMCWNTEQLWNYETWYHVSSAESVDIHHRYRFIARFSLSFYMHVNLFIISLNVYTYLIYRYQLRKAL